MKILIGILLLPLFSYTQELQKDTSLMKYSYFIYGNNLDHSIQQGTAFFIRRNKKIYLGTARHLITGYDDVKGAMENNYPDTLYVRIYDKDNKPYFLPINIKSIKETTKQDLFYQSPDLYFYRIIIPQKFKVNTLEKYILNFSMSNQQPENVFACGYPIKRGLDDRKTHMILSPTIAYGRLFTEYSKTLGVDNTMDSLDYPIKYNGDDIHQGFSGCPAYFILNGNIIFGGVFFMFNSKRNIAYFVRPEVVRKMLLELK